MDDNPGTRRIAQCLLKRHHDKALAVATERVRDRLATQDYASAAIWARVAETVHVLMPDAKPTPKPTRACLAIGASLDQLRQWRPSPLLRLKVRHLPRAAAGPNGGISPATNPGLTQRNFVLRKRSA